MALFVDVSSIVINNPQIYQTILLDNRTQSIRVVINDIEINHKLIIERLYINDNDCYVNTSRGNFILNTEDSRLHLVFYNKRWLSIGRDSALPLLDTTIDRQMIQNYQFQNCSFGEHLVQTEIRSSNNGINGKYYISDRLLVAAKNYHMNQLGCIFVYSKDNNNQYTILDDMITIPYNPIQGEFQGKFGSMFDLIDMNGFHYLVVCAPNRKRGNSDCTVYIYSYRKRLDNTFYFKHETLDNEIIVPRIESLKKLVITKNKGFHLIFEKEIITYYVSTTNSDNIRISAPYPITTLDIIKDVQSTDEHVYVLSDSSIVKYAFPVSENSIVEITTDIDGLTGSTSFIHDLSGGTIVISDNKIDFYDQSQTLTNTYTSQDIIQSVDLYQNHLILMSFNGNIKRLSNQTSLQDYGNVPDIDNLSKIHFMDTSNVIVGFPQLSDGKVKQINLNTMNQVIIDNYKNISSIQPELFVTRDAENVIIYDRRTKIISVLNRNDRNRFGLWTTLLPNESLVNHLRFRDTILDVKINDNQSQILIAVKPYNDIKSHVIVCNLDTYSYISKISGTTDGFGTSIDIKQDIAVISDPNISDTVVSGVFYAKGVINFYDLKPQGSFNQINSDPLRSSSPIGKIVKLSSTLNEIVSIGVNNSGIHSTTLFSNISEPNYRKIIMNENVSDVEYFLEGRMILSNKDNSNKFYRYQKVNGCFEIITKKEVNIPSLTSVSSKITFLPLGKHYTFMYHNNSITMFDIREMKLIKDWIDNYTTNVSVSIDGSTISYANQNENGIEYIICS
jgi:hypothetical protein